MIRIDEQSLRRMICGSSVVIGGVQMALDELPVDVILEAACQACSARAGRGHRITKPGSERCAADVRCVRSRPGLH